MPPMVTNLPDGVRFYTTPHPTQGRVLGEALTNLNRGMSETEAIVTARQAFGAGGGGGTSVVTEADGEGNRVVVVHSNSFPQYGSGVVVRIRSGAQQPARRSEERRVGKEVDRQWRTRWSPS